MILALEGSVAIGSKSRIEGNNELNIYENNCQDAYDPAHGRRAILLRRGENG